MGQQLRTFGALAEDWGSIPNTHPCTSITPVPEDAFFDLCGHQTLMRCTQTHAGKTRIHTKMKQINLNKFKKTNKFKKISTIRGKGSISTYEDKTTVLGEMPENQIL